MLGDDPKSPWDDDSLGSYFTLMGEPRTAHCSNSIVAHCCRCCIVLPVLNCGVVGFLFHLNTLRLDQQRLPVAIALLLATYMIVAIYVSAPLPRRSIRRSPFISLAPALAVNLSVG